MMVTVAKSLAFILRHRVDLAEEKEDEYSPANED